MNDGKGAALWFTASPLYDTRGRIVGAIESIRDITEWKEAEKALNESEKRFRECLPTSCHRRSMKRISGKSDVCQPDCLCEMFGYTREDFERGLNILDMVILSDREKARDAIHEYV